MSDAVTLAAGNNAAWCHAVCRSHGIAAAFHGAFWLADGTPPPFYPKLVTLAGTAQAGRQSAAIAELAAADGSADWAVKDCFAALDLAPIGFRILFEAIWIWRPVMASRATGSGGNTRWARLIDARDLGAWENSWAGNLDQAACGSAPSLFRPSLLTDPDIAFFAGWRDGKITAGAVANRAAGVVGLSNIFTTGDEPDEAWSDVVAHAGATFPDLPLVGYEDASVAQSLQKQGFAALAPLRVWIGTAEESA